MKTPRAKRKRPPINSPYDNSIICPICLDPIIDATEDTEGQEAIYCESTCDAWLRRQCAGLSRILYISYQDGDDPFYCPHCRLTKQNQQLQEFKTIIENFSKEVLELKGIIPQPLRVADSQKSVQQSQDGIKELTSSVSSNSDNNRPVQPIVTTISNKARKDDDKAHEDRKFNVVIHGLNEFNKGTPRHERFKHNLDKVTSIVAEGKIASALYLFEIS